MAWEYTHCQNNHCKHYWEDSCTRSFDKKMTALDSEGKCMRFEKGESDYYKHSKEDGEQNGKNRKTNPWQMELLRYMWSQDNGR